MSDKSSFTLQRKGELRAPNGDPELQAQLNTYVPYEYIIRWFQSHEGRTGIANRVLIIQSGTASGKSTTIPAEMFGQLVRHRYATGGGIICTQPRILTTISNAKQIAAIPKFGAYLRLGETIGWSTQFSKLKPRRIGLLSATIGVLTMQLQVFTDSEIMDMYRYILIDEAHERPLVADITLTALKGFLQRNATNPRCPFVVLMSATIDPPKFARYFLGPNQDGTARTIDQLIDNIIICNSAPSFERQKIWPEAPITNIITESVRIIRDIMDKHPAPRETWDPTASAAGAEASAPSGHELHLDMIKGPQQERDDILIFLPGIAEMTSMRLALRKFNKEQYVAGKPQVAIVMLNSAAITENQLEYRQLDIPIREIQDRAIYERRVIVSTSVAETGMTFNTLRYVIDAGYSRENEYNPNLKATSLLSKPAQLSRIEQRWGRVGRKFPGVIYPLYTEQMRNSLQPTQYPEIITSCITPVILQIVFEQQKIKTLYTHETPYFRVQDIDMIDPPQPDMLLDALEHAYGLGFIAHAPPEFSLDIDEFFAKSVCAAHRIGITKLGRIALELTSILDSLESIRMILAGFAWGYRPVDLIAIATFTKLRAQDEVDEESETESTSKRPKKRAQLSMNVAYQEVFPVKMRPDGTPIEDDATGLGAMDSWHTALGDTFFDGLIMSAAIDKIFEQTSKKGDFTGIQQWWSRLGVSFESMLQFIEVKDTICNCLLTLGFDPYKGTSILDIATSREYEPAALSDAIMRYKRCIYDGYRANVIRWNELKNQYETFTGLHVDSAMIDQIFRTVSVAQSHVAMFVVDKFQGRLNRTTMTYDIIANQISILDGFIGHDPLFIQ